MALYAVSAGILSHLLFFIHGEHTLRAFTIAKAYLFTFTGTVVFLCLQNGMSYLGDFVIITTAYFTGLFLSIIAYRLLFHRLRSFNGPFAAKISKLYDLWMSRNFQYYSEIEKLHQEYGSIVRTGPNELSLCSVDALVAVHGPQSQCSKGPVYEISNYKGVPNLARTRDKVFHKERRKLWEQSFTAGSVKGYENKVKGVLNDWMEQIHSNEGQSMDISSWMRVITFDIIGDIGFSQHWGAVKEGKLKSSVQFEAVLLTFGRCGWLATILRQLSLRFGVRGFVNQISQVVGKRQKGDVDRADIMSPLIENYNQGLRTVRDYHLLVADGQALTAASTSTLNYALTCVFYHLATEPWLQDELYQALHPYFEYGESSVPNSKLSQIPLLEATITESLRLHSPAAATLQRVTPPEGLMVGDTHIPGGVNVYVPFYALGRDERYFKKPLNFIPERWTKSPDMVIDKRAYVPFSLGRYNCIGKQVALMEMRMVLAYTLRKYKFALAPGEDGLSVFDNTLDLLVLKPGSLNVMFEARVKQ